MLPALLMLCNACAADSAIKSPVMDLTEDTACESCNSADDADNMLLCDKCNRGYHVHCLTPKLPAIPEGEWFCQRCKAKRAEGKGKSSVGTGKKSTVVVDSDSDAEEFQAPPSKPAGRMTARQGAILGKHAVAACVKGKHGR